MLLEYYTIRLKDAEPGKGLLHTTQHYDEVRSSIKHFKDKHPDQDVVAYKHEIKKGPMGATFKRKAMFGKTKASDPLQEATRSFKTLMRSIEDKKSIKNLHVPAPSERNPDGSMKVKATEPKKINESNTAYHRISVTVSDPNHTMITKRKDKVQKFIRVMGDEATAIDRAKAHYKKRGLKVHSAEYVQGYDKHIEESTSSFTHMVHVQGNLDNPALERHLKKNNGDYHQETEKGSSYKFKSKVDAAGFKAGLKSNAKDIYSGDVYHINSTRVDESVVQPSSTKDAYPVVKHTHQAGEDKYEVRGAKYPSTSRPRHAIYKNNKLHSMAGSLNDAKARINYFSTSQ